MALGCRSRMACLGAVRVVCSQHLLLRTALLSLRLRALTTVETVEEVALHLRVPPPSVVLVVVGHFWSVRKHLERANLPPHPLRPPSLHQPPPPLHRPQSLRGFCGQC